MQESETLELKTSTSELKEAIISISAILNKHQKGELYFGISNQGRVIGQQITENTLSGVSQTIVNNIEPKVYPEIKAEEIEGKSCIKVSFEGHEQPYFAYGKAYMRVADEDRQLSAKELENLILRKNATKFDSSKSDCTIDDIDEETLKNFILKANEVKRISYKYANKKEVLIKFGLLVDGKITQAGKLLFSNKAPLEVQSAVFAGINKVTFLDIKQFKGNIFELLRLSESYIKEHINWRAKLETRTREEIPEIPLRAITEALVNSFCHRDYLAPESNKIAIYKDRVDIWNPGDFPSGYTPLDFITADLPSILRNPLVANILYLSADIEKWGSGLRRIKEACDLDFVPVKFDVLKYGFSVIFERQEFAEAGMMKTGEKTREKTREKIIALIRENHSITSDEIARRLHLTEKGVEWQLKKLKENDLIRRIGPDKGGHWEVK
ncbi:putative DNA binding domain-containing protein [Candidatus Woesearchaeota archaeon]|nr:putative DNA binding domain-containing protein [Candidatus Woesearchaeota archaeon]